MNVNLTPNITGKNVNIIKGATQADLTNSVNNSKIYRDEAEAFSIVSEAKSVEASYSALNASISSTTASDKATIATTKANEANNSAINASASEAVCIAKATISTDNANIAIAQATIATNKATEANTSANTANTQANIAITKASEASISAINALTSENNADTSEANALIYRNQAESFANSINPSNLVHISGAETITGNKTFSGTVSGLTKATVGLSNVDNTSDSAKNVLYATTAGTASANDVYAWAKASVKPTYTASEVGLGNVTNESKATMFTNPTFTGTATGTFSGSLSGNATTATSAVSATTATTAANLTGLSQSNIVTVGADLNTITTAGFYRLQNGHVNGISDYGQMLVMHAAADTITQIVGAYNSGTLYTRSGNPSNVGGGGAWTSWKTILASDNYNSYAPSLTGVGASGTWGINITGNAATATTATNFVNSSYGTNSISAGTGDGATRTTYNVKFKSWYGTAYADNTDTVNRVLDHRTGIFYSASGSSFLPEYACRAWVNFNGTGTVAIRASGNVSSITDNGVGDYTINFTNAMPDANYGISSIGAVATNYLFIVPTGTPSTTRYQLLTSNVNGTAQDPTAVSIAIHR